MHNNNTSSSLYLHQQATLQSPSTSLASKPLPPTPQPASVPEPAFPQASETTGISHTVRKRISRDSGQSYPKLDVGHVPSTTSSKPSRRRYRPPKVSTAAGDSASSEFIARSSNSGITSTASSLRKDKGSHSIPQTFHEDPDKESQSTASYDTYTTPSTSTYTDPTLTSSAPSTTTSTSGISRRLHNLRKRIYPNPEERTPDFDYVEAERYLNYGLLVAACSVALIYLPVEEHFKKSVDKVSKGKVKGGHHDGEGDWRVKGDTVQK